MRKKQISKPDLSSNLCSAHNSIAKKQNVIIIMIVMNIIICVLAGSQSSILLGTLFKIVQNLEVFLCQI